MAIEHGFQRGAVATAAAFGIVGLGAGAFLAADQQKSPSQGVSTICTPEVSFTHNSRYVHEFQDPRTGEHIYQVLVSPHPIIGGLNAAQSTFVIRDKDCNGKVYSTNDAVIMDNLTSGKVYLTMVTGPRVSQANETAKQFGNSTSPFGEWYEFTDAQGNAVDPTTPDASRIDSPLFAASESFLPLDDRPTAPVLSQSKSSSQESAIVLGSQPFVQTDRETGYRRGFGAASQMDAIARAVKSGRLSQPYANTTA